MRRTRRASASDTRGRSLQEGALAERPLFNGFEEKSVRGLRLRMGGEGRPLLLLHGHPQTHAMWHAVAESLAEDFSIVAADLPGYGRSAPTATGSKREMAAVLVDVMDDLGFERFFLAGHDRGGRCAYRLPWTRPTASTALRCWTSSQPPKCGDAWTRSSV